METPSQFIHRLLLENYSTPSDVRDALVSAIASRDAKLTEDAYRKGVRDAEGMSDVSPLLITSQVAAHEIYKTRSASFTIEQENGGLTIRKKSVSGSDAICISAVNSTTIKII